jgi:hypothetical protein
MVGEGLTSCLNFPSALILHSRGKERCTVERKNLQVLILAAALCVLTTESASAKSRRKPHFVTYRVAGAQLTEVGNEIARDPRTGYYLAGRRD